jgi:hypothetical protein
MMQNNFLGLLDHRQTTLAINRRRTTMLFSGKSSNGTGTDNSNKLAKTKTTVPSRSSNFEELTTPFEAEEGEEASDETEDVLHIDEES